MFWLAQINNGRQMVADTITLPKMPKADLVQIPIKAYQDGFGIVLVDDDGEVYAEPLINGDGVAAPQYICACTLKNDSDEPLTAYKVLPSMRFKVPYISGDDFAEDIPVVGTEVEQAGGSYVQAKGEGDVAGKIFIEDVDPLDKVYEVSEQGSTVKVLDVIVRIYPVPGAITLE